MSAAKKAKLVDATEIARFIDARNAEYETLHLAYEEQFWGTKMGLKKGDFSDELLASTKLAMESWLASPAHLAETRRLLASGAATPSQARVLTVFERSFACYQMESEEAALREEVTKMEGEPRARGGMKLGVTDSATGAFEGLSSVGLRNAMKTSPDAARREACYAQLASIGPRVCEAGFVEIVKKRNAMAVALGFADFYDYKCTQAEGFGKARLFEMLDALEEQTRPPCAPRASGSRPSTARRAAAVEHGLHARGRVDQGARPVLPV